MDKSPYDLDNIVLNMVSKTQKKDFFSHGKKKKEPASNDVPKDYTQILKNYIEIPREEWGSILIGTYIRYMKNNGDLKKGARLKRISPGYSGTYVLHMEKYGKGKSYEWSASTHNMKAIYRYADSENPQQINQTTNQTTQQLTNQTTQQLTNQTTEQPTEQEEMLDNIGSKLLFNDNTILEMKIKNMEAELTKLRSDFEKRTKDLKSLFVLVKKIHNQIKR